jgi:hypothetical protein
VAKELASLELNIGKMKKTSSNEGK